MDTSEESTGTDAQTQSRDRRRRQRLRKRQVGRRPELATMMCAIAPEEHKRRLGRLSRARQPAQMPHRVPRRVQQVKAAVAEEINRPTPSQHQLGSRKRHLAQLPTLVRACGNRRRPVLGVAGEERVLEPGTDDEVRGDGERGRVARVVPVVVTVLKNDRETSEVLLGQGKGLF